MLWDHLTQLPCMATPAFYTSTALCILSSSHSVLEWSVLLKLRAKSSMMLRILWPSPVRNQWHSLYYHPGFGPNVAKTEQLPYEFYTYLSQTSNINQENRLDKHAPTDTETPRHTRPHMQMQTHSHQRTHTKTHTQSRMHTYNAHSSVQGTGVYTFLGNSTHATKEWKCAVHNK